MGSFSSHVSKNRNDYLNKHSKTSNKDISIRRLGRDASTIVGRLATPCTSCNKWQKIQGETELKETAVQTRYAEAAKLLHKDGDVAKAFKAIVQPSQTSPVSFESLEVLRSLHPKRLDKNNLPDLPTINQDEDVPDVCTSQSLWQYIRSSKSGKAPGVDGLRIEHLKSMSKCRLASWLTSMLWRRWSTLYSK